MKTVRGVGGIIASLAKGAVCAGGTRLPPTEPTGENGYYPPVLITE